MRGLKIGSAVAVALIAAACADQTPPTAPSATRGLSLSTVGSQGEVCPDGISTPLIWKTNKGAPVSAGNVLVSNDKSNFYIAYTTTGTWKIDQTFIMLPAKVSDVPTKKNGDVKLEKFTYVKSFSPLTNTYVATIPLGTRKAGDQVIVVAAADVRGTYNGSNVERITWSGNTVMYPGVRSNHPAVDATYLAYTVAACDAPPPPADTTTKDTTTTPTDTTHADTTHSDTTHTDTTVTPPTTGKGVITVTFDDGFRDAYTYGFAELKKYGIAGNIAVNPGPIDSGWTGYLTLSMLNEMHAAGWSVVSHSYNHPDLTTLSDAELDRELKMTQDWIRAHGYRGANVFVVPFHSWGTREATAIKKYYNTARGHNVGEFWPDSMATYPTTNQYGLTGYEPEYAPYTTVEGRAATRAIMQRAVDEGKFVDIFFHQIPSGNAAAFAEMAKIIAEFKPYIRTYSAAFPGA